MKKSSAEIKTDALCEQIRHLTDSLSKANWSNICKDVRIKELEEEIKKLKQEKADLLNENIKLLQAMREILRGDMNG